ncbi:MAG: twin-arginine translocase subunit TatB [Bdellovibrionales bacterium]|nr:twin-arginine translocase subunit TatB [Bdellovibrionales bacterium]
MFGLGFTEIIIILVVALIVLGPQKLPEVARTLGRTLGEVKRAADDFRREMTIAEWEDERRIRAERIQRQQEPSAPPSDSPPPKVAENPAEPEK